MSSPAVRRSRLVLPALLLAIVAGAPVALAGPGKNYTVDVGGTAVAGRDVAFKVTFAVPASQQQQLGSAELTAPAGFTPRSAAIAGLGSVSVGTGSVLLQGLELQPGQSVAVTVVASVPCSPLADRWSVLAKQANEFNGPPGNSLTLDAAASSLRTPVVGVCAPCEEDAACSASAPTGRSHLSLTGLPNAAPDAGQLSLAFGAGLQLDCAGYAELTPGTALFDVTGGRSKRATLVVPKADMPRGASGLELCFGADAPFTTKSGAQATPQGGYDFDADGTPEPVYVGLLPDCGPSAPPCIARRGPVGGDGLIEASLPPGDPGMRG